MVALTYVCCFDVPHGIGSSACILNDVLHRIQRALRLSVLAHLAASTHDLVHQQQLHCDQRAQVKELLLYSIVVPDAGLVRQNRLARLHIQADFAALARLVLSHHNTPY